MRKADAYGVELEFRLGQYEPKSVNGKEVKNQWGWNGYTTHNITPSRLMANLIALVYNWWSLYARLYNKENHREAITSDPTLLHEVARLLRHAGQSTIKVSLQHENSDVLVEAITKVSTML